MADLEKVIKELDRMTEDAREMDLEWAIGLDDFATLCEAVELLKEQQQKTGRWKCHGEPPMLVVECSECGQKFFNPAMQPFANYCSMCGAKMENAT